MTRMWDLDDLVGTRELATLFGFGRAAVSNWPSRHADFPAPLLTLAAGPMYSRKQVQVWFDSRDWRAGKHDQAARA